MSEIRLTEQQERVIRTRGNGLIVAAGAGCGKTFVLVQRVLEYLCQKDHKLDRLIITTFTKSTAAELRMKLRIAVEERLKTEPSEHLRRQLALIGSAEIGTIDSFCHRLITRYFERAGIDPRSREMTDIEQKKMEEEEADAMMEELYSSEDEGVALLLKNYATGRSDERLKKMLLSGLEKLENRPQPRVFIRRAIAYYEQPGERYFEALDGAAKDYFDQRILSLLERAADYREITAGAAPGLRAELCAFSDEETAFCADLPRLAGRGYSALREVQPPAFKTYKKSAWQKKFPEEAERIETADLARKRFKEAVKAFQKDLEPTERERLDDLKSHAPQVRAYLTLCRALQERLEKRRRAQRLLTFGDTERLALSLLYDEDAETGALTVSELARTLQREYDEIIVDESQDINSMQDLIFQAISRSGANLFTVGDVKQSIYSFRYAEPELFEEKRRNAAPYQGETITETTVLDLNTNFRSRSGVLDFCNAVFSRLMSREAGGVAYDEAEALRPADGNRDPAGTPPRAALQWVLPEENKDTVKQTAEHIARLIRRRVENGARYGDFAILLRSAKEKAALYERVLGEAGIPVINQKKTTPLFLMPEVLGVLSYLAVLNNPYDDISMAALLYGDFFRFTVNELVKLRKKEQPLYENLRAAGKKNPRAAEVLEAIDRYRTLSETVNVYDLLQRIYAESGIFSVYSAEKGGMEKIANLELLAEEARSFEKDRCQGLYLFIRHIQEDPSEENGGARLDTEKNSVIITTIHNAKGLEYPVVILGDAKKGRNRQDHTGDVLWAEPGIAAMKECDPAVYYCGESLPQKLAKLLIARKSVSEEIRLLYVAITRARNEVIVPYVAETEEMRELVKRAARLPEKIPPPFLRESDGLYGKWLFSLLASSAEGAELRREFGIPERAGLPPLYAAFEKIFPAETLIAAEEKQAEEPFDPAAFHTRLDWAYPYLAAAATPAKLSVSELKGMREEDPEAETFFKEEIRARAPRFTSAFAPRGNEIGNALHQALQYSDFERLAADPESELNRLCGAGFILPRQRDMITVGKIRAFTESPVFKRLMRADYYSKEERFLFPMDAADVLGPGHAGEILIQGVLDCYFVENGEATVLDYKTDRVSDPEELARRYRVQMDFYAEALKRVKNLRVAHKIIYSFSLEKEIEL